MPLNNLNLPKEIIEMFENLPLDETCIERNSVPYQTKVQVYDEKCSGCGFARIVVYDYHGITVYNKIEDALKQKRKECVERTCSYPGDLVVVGKRISYPSVREIVNNTCMFWKMQRLNIPPDDEMSFIEILVEDEKEIIKSIEGIQVSEPTAVRTERVSEI